MRNFFEGRLARLAFFWRWIVSSFLASLVSLMIESQATNPQTGTVTSPLDGVSLGLAIATVAGLLLAAYQLSLIARRLRSAGLNPWLTLLYLVPVANIVIFLICLFKSPSEESRPEFHEARNGTVLPPSSPVPGSASSRNTSLGGGRDDDSVSVADALGIVLQPVRKRMSRSVAVREALTCRRRSSSCRSFPPSRRAA